MKKILLLLPLVLLSGCWKVDELPSVVDRMAFQHTGGTLFHNPDLLTIKEIHLDNGTLTGREIIVEGKVETVSEHSTYLVLSDETARMLVVLTDLESVGPMLQSEKPKAMKVLGTVENGKKGLPYIKARSVNLTLEPGSA